MASKRLYVIGQVMRRGVGRSDTLKIRCLQMTLNTYLNKYFNKTTNIWAMENNKNCNVGDIVLLKEQSENITPRVKHCIEEVVFPLGMVIDPVTEKRCRGTEYINETQRQSEAMAIAELK